MFDEDKNRWALYMILEQGRERGRQSKEIDKMDFTTVEDMDSVYIKEINSVVKVAIRLNKMLFRMWAYK